MYLPHLLQVAITLNSYTASSISATPLCPDNFLLRTLWPFTSEKPSSACNAFVYLSRLLVAAVVKLFTAILSHPLHCSVSSSLSLCRLSTVTPPLQVANAYTASRILSLYQSALIPR